ncbi:MAG: helix-turn-helix transcriptional regulator [Bacteroidia bacterium]|nr:helix-turn-helix transcriptional regulator [Bacteroidia bacterium]
MKNTLKVQRAIKNLTQAELAEKAGVTRQTINYIEIGKYIPTTVLSLKLAKVLGKPVEELFILEKGD